jgi:putative endonuclease
MYYVYILISIDKKRTYTGSTRDLQRRLLEHNAGKVQTSKAYRPFKILHFESFEDLKAAIAREKFFKSTSGRRLIKKIFQTFIA